MPVIDLGPVVGPQGPQGATGATGAQGIQGLPGPSQVTATTSTNLTGVLYGNGTSVMVRPVDSAPTTDSANLVSSGGVFSAISDAVTSVSPKSFSLAAGKSLHITASSSSTLFSLLVATNGARVVTSGLFYLSGFSQNDNYHIITPLISGATSIGTGKISGAITITNNHGSDTVSVIVTELHVENGTMYYTVV